MATNNGNVLIGWVGALDGGDKAGGTDDVEGGDTEKTLGVVDALGLEDFGADWDSGVDLISSVSSNSDAIGSTYWVGNDKDVGIRRRVGNGLCEVANN